MTKYIFVTGGVLSGLGKGITAASCGNILKARGLKIWMQKFDQYLNVDAGTLNPNEHGEVFVLDDGSETDLDLGHYERFLNLSLDKTSSVMSGQIYQAVLEKERSGKYLGKTIQMIPHVTDEVKSRIHLAARRAEPSGRSQKCDVLITEIGGTIGDYEGTHFIEAIRQMQYDVGKKNVLYVHVGFLPYLGASEELKSKPIQNSVHDLQAMGIQPDIVIARSDWPVNGKLLDKISLFCGIEREAVIPLESVDSIYKVPMILEKFNLDKIIAQKLKLKLRSSNDRDWHQFVAKINKSHKKTKIALVGKYLGMKDTYFSVTEALKTAAIYNNTSVEICWVDAEEIESASRRTRLLKDFDGILVPGGFGSRGIEGKIAAIKYARTKKIPFLGLCYGLQLATIEFARNVSGLRGANTTEINPKTPYPVVYIMPEQEKLIEGSQYGGTMRLGTYPCLLKDDTMARKAYKTKNISERHRHRYEVNNKYRERLEQKGLIISGTSPNGQLVEIIELKDHPFFVATQFHPELKSRPLAPHPLFMGFIKASIK